MFSEYTLCETAVVESVEDTDKMQDIAYKIPNTTVSIRCKRSIYNLASRDEDEKFDEILSRRGRSCYSIFSGGWKMQIGKRKVLLKPNPNRDDVEKKAWNFKCGEKSLLSPYVV